MMINVREEKQGCELKTGEGDLRLAVLNNIVKKWIYDMTFVVSVMKKKGFFRILLRMQI